MDWLSLIMQLLALLLAKDVSADDVAAVLGRPISKSDRRWHLEVSKTYADDLREALIHIEDLTAGRDLVTTVELRFSHPWRIIPATLDRALGGIARSLPGLHPGQPKSFAYDVERDGRQASILLSAHSVDGDPDGSIEITKVLIRRFYE